MTGRLAAYVRRNAIGLMALFIALAGTSYALASASSSSGQLFACVKNKGGAARFVKKSAKCHKGEHRVSWNKQGPPGLQGPKGNTGGQGVPGNTGPTGAASKSAFLAGPVSTGSSSPTDLGGPSVTVNVGPSGLVAFWATATIQSAGGTAEVWLFDNTGEAPQMSNSGLPVKMYTLPASDNGTILFNGGLSTTNVGPGTQTFTLKYDDTSGTGTFSNVELVVIPL